MRTFEVIIFCIPFLIGASVLFLLAGITVWEGFRDGYETQKKLDAYRDANMTLDPLALDPRW